MKLSRPRRYFGGVVLAAAIAAPSQAAVIYTASGISAKGVAVSFEAQMEAAGDLLTLTLSNNSPVDSANPDDTIGSFYFDVVDGARPELNYVSAAGDLYSISKKNPDTLLEVGADLMVSNAPGGWQFKSMDASSSPYLGFGIGTVGNSALSANGFKGKLVGALNYAIYTGEDISKQSLENKTPLVKHTATFVFSGMTGFTEADLAATAVFGLGTGPDTILSASAVSSVPVPAAAWLFGSALLGLGGLSRRAKLKGA